MRPSRTKHIGTIMPTLKTCDLKWKTWYWENLRQYLILEKQKKEAKQPWNGMACSQLLE